MYRWYWFRKLQLGETDLEEPRPAGPGAVKEIERTVLPSRATARDGRVRGEYGEGAAAA